MTLTAKPRTLILRTAGTNCDAETAYAFELAGARTQSVHVNQLLREPGLLDAFQILAVPGGFSYGDDIAAGRILANQIAHHLGPAFRQFVDSGQAGHRHLQRLSGPGEDQPPARRSRRTDRANLHAGPQRLRPFRRPLGPSVARPGKCIWTRRPALPTLLNCP